MISVARKLSFHPLAFTRVSTYQRQDSWAKKAESDKLSTIVIGLSVDPVPAKHALAEEVGVKEAVLLSDFCPHGEVAQECGVFDAEEGFSKRAVFVVGEDGTMLWKKGYLLKEDQILRKFLQF